MFRKKTDFMDIKENNQRVILKTILDNSVISRAEISKILKLSKPTVNEHIDNLIFLGIIKEIGEGHSQKKGGRKPILIAPNEEFKYIIAVDFSYTQPNISLGNILGLPVDKFSIERFVNFETAKKVIYEAISLVLDRNNITIDKISSIVISIPGIVNDKKEVIIYNKRHEKLYTLDIISFLKENFHIPVLVKNDVNMAAIAEERYLSSEGISNLIFFSVGNGFGAGIMINGRLYEGLNNAAGEIGFFTDFSTGETLENIVAIDPLINQIKLEAKKSKSSHLKNYKNISFSDIVEAYKVNDEVVINILKKVGRILGICANNCVSILDIDTIVLGGDYIAFKEVLITEMEKVFSDNILIAKPKIIPSVLNYSGGLIGCFEVGIDHLITTLKV